MLFVNFLCLLYLMLLVNGLTVSRNIDDSYFDEKVDSLHDFEYTTRHKAKHDKFLHKHKRVKSGVNTPASKITISVTTNETKSTKTTLRPQHIKLHKSTKRRIGGFWRKFKIKDDKALEREKRLKHRFENVNYEYKRPLYNDEYKRKDKILVTKRRKNTYTLPYKKKKREVINKIRNGLNKQKEDKALKNIEVNIAPYENFTNSVKAKTHVKTISNDEELKRMVTTMTTKVTELKQLYGLEHYKPSYTSTHKILNITKPTIDHATPTTKEELDIPGTAQLEALLNDIKEKALHLIVEQNPAFNDLITNSVTEATFEADPLLTHLEINSPTYSLYNFITLNSDFGKRNAYISKQYDEKSTINVEMSTNNNREGRSVAEEAMKAAQSIEDILQKGLKNIYKKVKNKVSGDFCKEVDKVKTTLKPQNKKVCSKNPSAKQPTTTKPAIETSKKTTNNTQLIHSRGDRKSDKYTTVTKEQITTTPTADDYALLTIYEQMLSKTCQNNIMNMVTSSDRLIRQKRNKQLVSKRNLETLFDQHLKEDVKKLYEDREDMPDELEYTFDVNVPEISTAETVTESDYSHTTKSLAKTKNEIDEDESMMSTGMTPCDDNSYESLTSKISYNEFVNGYKHYLNFQKEQGNEHFSNLVRYQAHRHHNVDDIGKYILNKIPQLPSRDKRFFEYEDDHDSTTKSEESWFKKHFYMFIDNGTPKKYHTSQTVSLKSPTPDAYDTSVHKTQDLERSEFEDKLKVSSQTEDNAVDINLDKLSQVLEDHRASPVLLPVQENVIKDSISKNTGKRHGHIFKSLTPHIIDKVFGKDRKTLDIACVESNCPDLNYNNLEAKYLKSTNNRDVNFLFTDEINRKKRNTKNSKEKSTTFGEKLIFQTKKSAKLINVTKTKKKTDNAKPGCVHIDVVVPPTSIVKLKGTKRKEGKLKKLMQKLHIKSNKNKIKRDYRNTIHTRKQRSNPFQKLKNIFKSTPKSKVLKAGSHLSDYDIMSSHIDTFKLMKFDKLLNIEEMKKQIPNITGDLVASASPKFSDNEVSWNLPMTEKGFTDFAVLTNTTLKSTLVMTPATNSPHLVEERKRHPTTKSTKKSKMLNIEELLKVNDDTKSTYGPSKKITKFPQHMSLNDIKDQVENIIIKMNADDNNKIYSTEGITNSINLINTKMPIDKVTLKSNFDPFFTKISKDNIYSKDNSKINPNSEKHTILDLEQNSEFVEDNIYFKTPISGLNINGLMTTQTPIATLIPAGSLLSLSRSINNDEKWKYKPYPDYFSDLLMWNKDILNSDRVPTPWLDILRNMNHELEYSTPDMSDNNIQQELIKNSDGLNPHVKDFKEPPISTYNHKGISNCRQSMILEQPPIGKSIFMEQEKRFVKFDPKLTDKHLKATDFVNELNKFAKTYSNYTKHNLDKLHNTPEHYFENKDQSVILVDTTLLAYDDDVNYISTLTPRELSKNALKIANLDNKVAPPIKAKSNKQPLQYFATPLPMKMTDFEEFLKANSIDVESVTSPIVDLPTINSYNLKEYSKTSSIKKIQTTPITKKIQKMNKAKTTKIKAHELHDTRKIPFSITNENKEMDLDNQFDYLDDLKWNMFKDYYNSEGKERFKRYNDLNYDSYVTNINTDRKQWNKPNKEMEKHKMTNKIPFKNIESDLNGNEIPEATESVKDFEITIINFGDINKLTDEYAPIRTETTSKDVTEVTETTIKNKEKIPLRVDLIEKDSKDSEFLHKLHNDLFYNHAYSKSEGTATKASEIIKIDESTVPTPPLAFHEAVLKKMPIKTDHEPKRVRISGHSYKYDIIYHHPEKINKDRDTHLPFYITTTEIATPKEMFSSYDSDFGGAGESDVARGDSGKSRIVRKVKTSSVKSNKEIQDSANSTLRRNSKKHTRRHKLKRLFPVIQDKLKMFTKNSSSLSNFLQKPSTVILPSSSAKSNMKANVQRTKLEIARAETAVTKFMNHSGNSEMKQIKMMPTDFSAIDTAIRIEPHTYNVTDANNKEYINKREIQDSGTHTAKNVAALEVIVDMMKNPLKYDENNRHSTTNRNNKPQVSDTLNAITNSIQVHIAVPYDIENSKKRSLESVKLRKVFTAKLSTPVDIEYQVHSIEEPPTTKNDLDDMEGLSPGFYLLVDKTYFPEGVALKPMKLRQATPSTKKITSTISTKNLAKVTLSKDFMSALKKQLILLYNLTNLNIDKRDVIEVTKRDKIKRSINWDVINKIFGHDRVCHCKCKVNKTLCSACAASDAVMSELIFEFENLSKYMTDHCTEIQTYFWMNPSGGKRLKDLVHKIDQSLRDYYKRVKGKCQGRTCKTFATFIDERQFHRNQKRSKDAGHNFMKDLETIAKDIEKATKTITCFKENLEEEVQKLKYVINNCILIKAHNKRSHLHYTEDKDVKNVYSLDKINVNIICNTESTFPYITSMKPLNPEQKLWIDTDYNEHKPKGFKRLLSHFRKKKKDKTFSGYFKQTKKSFYKREAKENQIESPLISDSGGTFWHDYIKKSSSEPRFARKSKVHTKHNYIAVPKKENANIENTKKELENNTLSTTEVYSTIALNGNSSQSEEFVSNINQFLKLFGNVDARHITEYKENPPPHKKTTHKNKTKKIKYKKIISKVHKNIKTKIAKIPNNFTDLEYKRKIEATTKNIRVTNTLGIYRIKSLFKTTRKTTTEMSTVAKANILKKNKKVGNINFSLDTFPIKREHNLSATSSECTAKYNTASTKISQNDVHVISNMTTESNPNIIIIDDTDELKSNRCKDLLLSIIDYESDKLNKEWMKFANIKLDKIETKRRNEHKSTKKLKVSMKDIDSTINYNVPYDLESVSEIETTKSISALLDKIGSKFKIKIINNEIAEQKNTKASKKLSTKKMITQSRTSSVDREADDSTAEPRICDIKATRQHILNIRKEMPVKDFEDYVVNVTCQKYVPVPKAILVGKTRNEGHRNMRKWSWIRDRRSTFRSKTKPKVNTRRIMRLLSSEFEVFYRGEHGIYKQNLRKKRCADFFGKLKDLPRLHDSENLIHALAGDTVNITYFDESKQLIKDLSTDNCAWETQRDNMLDYSNVIVNGDTVNIVDIQPKNDGYYICKKSGLLKRKIKLAVMTLPKLLLLTTLLYTKDTKCTHDDLKRFQLLGPEISKEVFQGQSYVNIDNSVCLEDKTDGETKVRALGTVNCRRPAVDCSVSCRRDLQASLTSMCAENIPALASIEVVLLKDGVNSTWRPSKYNRRSVVTRSLRDFTNHRDRQNPSEIAPGSVHLVESCPAGYRLLSHLKVCASCPVNTYAREGDNACLVCPRGSRSTPGANRCYRTKSRSRRYDWWICPPCGYSVAAVVALCSCGVCVALALLIQVTSCSCGTTDAHNAKDSSKLPTKMERRINSDHNRSSRIVLARFFKPSLASTIATDSQETKFDMWKARNLPPPLPPVDFDS